MTFIPNPQGLARVLISPEGMVGQMITRKGLLIAHQATINAAKIIPASAQFSSIVGVEFNPTAEGLEARIGVTDNGSMAKSLDKKAIREPDAWLVSALQAGRVG